MSDAGATKRSRRESHSRSVSSPYIMFLLNLILLSSYVYILSLFLAVAMYNILDIEWEQLTLFRGNHSYAILLLSPSLSFPIPPLQITTPCKKNRVNKSDDGELFKGI